MEPLLNQEICAEYASALEELTFNSKPVINNLTIIAHENIKWAREIVKVVEDRLNKAPVNEKLPTLYLLDSIVKNVGGVYIREFARNIVHTFCHAFEQVSDPDMQMQYYRLLKTWPAVFPPEKVQMIEQRLRATATMRQPFSRHEPRNIHVNPQFFQPTRGGYRQHHQPPHPAPRSRQYHQRVPPAQVPAASDLKQRIYTLLQREANNPELRRPDIAALIQDLHRELSRSQHQYVDATGREQYAQQQSTQLLNTLDQLLSTLHTPAPPVQQYISPQQSFAMDTQSTEDFIASLTQLGLLPPATSAPQSPGGYQQPQQPQQQPMYSTGYPVSQPPVGVQSHPPTQPPAPYSAGRAGNGSSTVSDPLIHQLYFGIPHQCKTCGLRFQSPEKLATHLDNHFSKSKQEKENKALSRKWLQSAEDWCRKPEEKVAESPGALFFGAIGSSKTSDASATEAQTSASTGGVGYDTFTAGSGVNAFGSGVRGLGGVPEKGLEMLPDAPMREDQTSCPVCGEKFDSYWDQSSEEWLFRDSIDDPASDKVLHKSCLKTMKRRASAKREHEESEQPVDEPLSKRPKVG